VGVAKIPVPVGVTVVITPEFSTETKGVAEVAGVVVGVRVGVFVTPLFVADVADDVVCCRGRRAACVDGVIKAAKNNSRPLRVCIVCI